MVKHPLGSYKNPIRITNWAVVSSGGPYSAPEANQPRITGEVEAHPKIKFDSDSRVMTTSSIIEFQGRKVLTKNNCYRLGVINKDYHKWLKTNYPNWDFRKPLKKL